MNVAISYWKPDMQKSHIHPDGHAFGTETITNWMESQLT
jgi:hypothetical protein